MKFRLTEKNIQIGSDKYRITGTFSVHKIDTSHFIDDFSIDLFEKNGVDLEDDYEINDLDLVLSNLETNAENYI